MSSSVRISVKHKQGMRGKSAILIFDILRPANSVPRKTSQPSSSSWAQRQTNPRNKYICIFLSKIISLAFNICLHYTPSPDYTAASKIS